MWSVQVTPPDGTHPVPTGCAAWVPACKSSSPLQPVDYLQVRRMQLPAESAEWPAPVDRPGAHFHRYYLGILDDGEPQLPAEAAGAKVFSSTSRSAARDMLRMLLTSSPGLPGQ